ncbi:MAG: hypothetical protein CMG00_08705 [Candidatus Marinimicrobia bacterium]|nr:hypothetical protein [Candidatus Neomarinimicrobiota bacterium]
MKKLISLLLLASVVISIFSATFTFKLSSLLLLPTLTILVICALPLMTTRMSNFFSPLAYLFYWIYITVFLRMLYIIYDLPNKGYVEWTFLHNNDKTFLIWPLIVIIVGMSFFILGYFLKPLNLKNSYSLISIKDWSFSRVYLVGILCFCLSAVALFRFVSLNIENIIFLTLDNLSSHRGISDNLREYKTSAFLRLAVQLSEISFYILFTYLTLSPKKKLNISILCVLCFIIASFFYLFTQSRSGLVFMIINPFILNYLLKDRVLNFSKVLYTFTIAVLLLYGITSLREGTGLETGSISTFNIHRLADPLIAHNGGFDVSKTGLIMDYIDKNESKKFGSSFLWIPLSFIPRSIWPDKPISIDTYFGMKVYEATTYGSGAVPPGLFSELYWNFGYIGIIIGCFIFGIVFRFIEIHYLIKGNNNINSLIIYVVCFLTLGVAVFGSSINSTIVGILYKIIPLIFILNFITSSKKIVYV